MQNITYSIFVLLFIILLSGCEKDNETNIGPSIRFIEGINYASNDTALKVGDQININIIADKGSSNIMLFLFTIEKDSEITSVDSGVNTTSFQFEKTITKSIAETEKWTFMVRDNNLLSTEVSITLTKSGEIIFGEITEYPSLILGAQNNTEFDNFFSFETDQTYSLEEAAQNQAKINLLYYYDFLSNEDNVISSPGASIDESVFPEETIGLLNWNERNTTRFIEKTDDITVEEFDNCQNDSLLLVHKFEFGSGKRKCKNLTSGKIFAFETEDEQYGLLKVINVSSTDEGSVEFAIKIKK